MVGGINSRTPFFNSLVWWLNKSRDVRMGETKERMMQVVGVGIGGEEAEWWMDEESEVV